MTKEELINQYEESLKKCIIAVDESSKTIKDLIHAIETQREIIRIWNEFYNEIVKFPQVVGPFLNANADSNLKKECHKILTRCQLLIKEISSIEKNYNSKKSSQPLDKELNICYYNGQEETNGKDNGRKDGEGVE